MFASSAVLTKGKQYLFYLRYLKIYFLCEDIKTVANEHCSCLFVLMLYILVNDSLLMSVCFLC